MKHFLLFISLLYTFSLQAIENNVELLTNKDFSNASLFATQASLAVTDDPGKWFAGNVVQFTTSIASGAFECASVAGATFYDYFLGQITSDATVNTGRYHFSINASGNQPFYIKISSVNALGTELSYSLKNASAPAIEKQASPDYSGYSLKVTPTGSSVTYSADLDLQNATPSALRIYIIFPNVGNVTVDDVSFMRTADVPTYTTFYVRPASDNSSWTSLTGIDPDQIVTSNSPTIVGTNTYYFAKGTYTLAGVAVTTGKIYGGFSGNESSINLSQRVLSDKDGNGIIEPWEMTNETVINGTFPISGSSTSTRLITVTGGEINGLTLQDHHCSNPGIILVGFVTSGPTADHDIEEYAGKMINCTVRKLKTSGSAPVMSTNKSSQIDFCLIEECSSTSTSTGATGAIFFNAVGGKLSNSVIRNNKAIDAGSSTRGGAIRTTSLANSDMNVIIENCVIYNNTSGGPGGAIRSDGAASKRGIQIINCTLVNNKTTTATNTGSIDMVNGGLVVNSIVVDDPQHEIRANSTNNYISNNAYGTYTGSTAYPNTNMESGKTAADFNFVSYSTFQGAMQPGDAGFVQATYDAIRASNFRITSTASVGVTTSALNSIPSSYQIGGTGSSVALTATVPTTDITGLTRAGSKTLGAYQATGVVESAQTLTITQPASMVSLTVNAGGTVTVNPGRQLTITGALANSGNLNLLSNSADGTATILTPATISGSGATYNVQQYVSSSATGPTGRNWYISSPLSAASTNTITTATGNGLVYYNGSTWVDEGATMEVMKGYIAKSPAQNTTINFTGGTLNTGNKSVTNLPLGFNLVGNPYASYVDFAQATKTNVTNSIWYRSKKEGTYNFHTYNVTGGISVKDGTAIIPPMQSFWIKTTSATNEFGFTNAMRSHQDQSVLSNRLKAPKASTQQLLRLQVSNGSYSDETVLYSDPHALNTYDEYDSPKMFNNISVVPEIFTQLASEKLVINGMQELPLNVEMPLGFTTLQANQFSISATEVNNLDTDVRVILSDKSTNPAVETDLTEGQSYSFYADATPVSANRFTLLFRAPNLSTNLTHTPALKAKVYVTDTNKINIESETQCNYTIYDIVGSIVTSGNTENTALAGKAFNKGIYIVKLDNQHSGFTTKVIIE